MSIQSDSLNSDLIAKARQLVLSRICLENVDPRDLRLCKEEDWFIEKHVCDKQLDGEKDVVSSAARSIEKCLIWRNENKINYLNDSDFPIELHHRSAYILDTNCSTLYIQASKHQKISEWSEVVKNFLIYNVEKFFQQVRQGKGSIVIDCRGAGLRVSTWT